MSPQIDFHYIANAVEMNMEVDTKMCYWSDADDLRYRLESNPYITEAYVWREKNPSINNTQDLMNDGVDSIASAAKDLHRRNERQLAIWKIM